MGESWIPPGELAEYRVVRRLGQGAMGEVWLAEDTLLGRRVAVKFPRLEQHSAEAKQRFIAEGLALARVRHANVIAVYHAGEVEDRPYLVTELLEGEALDRAQLPIDPAQLARIAADAAKGLGAAHTAGVLHRDLKPANLFRTAAGPIKLIDFGLAELDTGARAGDGAGTPYYLAPELWRGDPATRASDLYALGASIYHLAAGSPPHDANTIDELRERVLAAAPPSLSERAPRTPAALIEIIDRLLAAEPSARPESADEVRAALEARAAEPASTDAAAAPYRGLDPFREEDAASFFGRESEIESALDLLRGRSLAAIAGASGVGKTSLIEAGLIPRIRAGALGGPCTIVHLGDDSTQLARALAAENERILAVLDPLEQALELADRSPAWRRLLESLPELDRRVLVLAGVRSDSLDRLVHLGRFRDVVLRGAIMLRPLQGRALERAIAEPAKRRGYSFDPPELIEHVAGTGASLGLVEFALARLWEARDEDRRALTQTAFTSIGGVGGALALHADRAIAELPLEETRRLLLALVGEDGARIRASLIEETADPKYRTVLDRLLARGLVAAHEDGTYSLAHDALLHQWPKLRRWLDDEAHLRALRARLERATREWERLGRRDEALWSSRMLLAFPSNLPGIRPEESEFLAASRAKIRRRTIRRFATAALILTGASISVIVGLEARRRAEAVEKEVFVRAELERAGRALDQAGQAKSSSNRERERALALFTEGDDAAAEPTWARALELARRATDNYAEAGKTIDRARGRDPSSREAITRAVTVWTEWYELAERFHLSSQRAELEARLVADGGASARSPARLTVTSKPSGAKIFLSGREIGAGAPLEVPPGSHLLSAELAGRYSTRLPILLAGGRAQNVVIELPPASQIPAGFIFIPGGPTLIGSREAEPVRRALEAEPEHLVEIDPFAISQTETTFGEYLEFLRALSGEERERRRPRAEDIELTFRASDQKARLSLQGTVAGEGEPICRPRRSVRACRNWSRLPLAGVTVDDVRRYAKWLDETGRVRGARLCTAREWERAARGADGRTYPAGESLAPGSANVEETYGRDPEQIGPDEVGSYPADVSPFGVLDLAGNVFEFAIDARPKAGGRLVLRGGAWDSPSTVARASASGPAPDGRYISAGVRICAESPGRLSAE